MQLRRVLFSAALGLSFVATEVVIQITPTTVFAKKARRARKGKRGHKKKKPEEQKKEAEQAQAKAEERKAPARFSWTARTEKGKMDSRADAKRDEAILKLKRLLPTIQAGPQKAELIFRLSEMYWSKSKFKNLLAMQIWDEELEKWHDKGQNGKQPELEEIAELDESNLYKRQALKLYEQILGEYPLYQRKDEVLYNLGSSLYEAGKKKDGVKRYWELIKQYPDSDFSADAWLELGEHFFNSNKLNHAMRAYGKAAETRKPRIYSFALYKLAWCDYNLGEYVSALEKFRGVIEYAKKAKKTKGQFGKRDRIQLFEESLSDMVRTYSHLDSVDDAFEYYADEVGKKKSYKYLSKLAKLYDKEGKYALEVRAFKKLNTIYPYHPDAPENQTAIMNAYAQADKKDAVRAEVRRLVDLYSPTGTWAKKNAANQGVLDKAFEKVEEQLAGLVTEQHRAAQETKLVETYKLTRDIYKEYLDKFKDTVNSYEFRFFYADILYELKEFEPAALQYDRVVAANRKGKFVRHAGYASVLTWEKVAAGVKEVLTSKKITEGKRGKAKGSLKKLEQLHKLQKGQKYDETPLTPYEKKLANACDTFVEVAPGDAELVKVKFKSARLYYIHNQFELAAVRFGEIINKWPKDSLARISAESIVQSFNVREDWVNLNSWSRKFRGNKLLMADKTFSKKIDEFIEGSSFNEIHFVLEPKLKPLEIATHYAGFVKEFPKSKYAMVGLFNSIVNYDKSNLLEKSISTAQQVLNEYKNFKISAKDLAESKKEGTSLPKPEDIREKVMFLAASFYERLAEFEKAAALYEQYLSEFKKGPKRADAVFNAALFREGLGEYDKAMANFNAYIKEFPKKPDIPQIVWRIGLILEKKKDYVAVAKHFASYGRYVRDDKARQICAKYKIVGALEKLKKDKEAYAAHAALLKDYMKLKDADKKKPCPLVAAAAASFEMLQDPFQAYLDIPLVGIKDKQMAENLLKKLGQVSELQKSYTRVLQLGQGDFGIASLFRIGVIYQHLAQMIFDTTCPKRLSEDQCMIYQAALQEKAFPLEEKAIEAYDKALSKAYELGLYNEWLAKAQEALKFYEPQRFPDIHKYDLIASEATFEVPLLVELTR